MASQRGHPVGAVSTIFLVRQRNPDMYKTAILPKKYGFLRIDQMLCSPLHCNMTHSVVREATNFVRELQNSWVVKKHFELRKNIMSRNLKLAKNMLFSFGFVAMVEGSG